MVGKEWRDTGDAIVARSGRSIKIGGAGYGILGISADLSVFEAYDGDFAGFRAPDDDGWLDESHLTIDERIDVCDAHDRALEQIA